MEWLFGKRMTPEEMLKKNQRALNKAMRDLDREKARMEQQEKKIIMDIKKMAKEGHMESVKIMAKDLVRTRRYVQKFMLMKANIQAVSLKIQTLRSQNAMAQAMKGVTKAMQNMNRRLNLPQIQHILQEFEKQSEIMDMKEEIMNDAIDDAMDDEQDEEETDAVVSQVLDELGLQLNDQLSGLPQASGSLSVTPKVAVPAAPAPLSIPGYRYMPISRETYGISPRNIYPHHYSSLDRYPRHAGAKTYSDWEPETGRAESRPHLPYFREYSPGPDGKKIPSIGDRLWRGGYRRPALSTWMDPSPWIPITRFTRDPWWYAYPQYRPFRAAYIPMSRNPFFLRDSYLSPVKRTYLWREHPIRPFTTSPRLDF